MNQVTYQRRSESGLNEAGNIPTAFSVHKHTLVLMDQETYFLIPLVGKFVPPYPGAHIVTTTTKGTDVKPELKQGRKEGRNERMNEGAQIVGITSEPDVKLERTNERTTERSDKTNK